jgi:hypothetical protein
MGGVMKPVNSEEMGCNPTSSNCVIWQGPDIACLNLCKGDTITDVFFQLACLVCTIKDQLDVDTYDITCLDLATCDLPHTFREFIQILINKICELQDLIGEGGDPTPTAEQIVTVATCFSAELGPTATITNYVSAIGQKLCEQEVTIQNQQAAIVMINARLDILES